MADKEVLALLDHQVRTLKWGRMRESTPHRGVRGGAINAEMGLGKTIMGMEICEGKLNLLSCPKGLMNTWREELIKWHPERKVIYFHKDMMGASRYNAMTYEEMTSADLVITTYDVIQGVDRKHKFAESEAVSIRGEGMMEGKVIEVKCRRSLLENKALRGEDLLYAIKWRRLMIDEGHKICNHTTKVYKAMMAMYGDIRWVLTGTLIRNDDKNLWAILRFLGYTGCPSARNWDENVYFRERMDTVIKTLDYADAKIQLPQKHVHNLEYDFSEKEQAAYDVVKKRVVAAYNNMMLGNTNYMYVLALFTRLRQMCIAPHLITPEAKRSWRPSDSPMDEQARKELDEATGNLETWVHDREGTAGTKSAKMNEVVNILRTIPAGEKVIIFSVWTSALDLIEDALIDAFGASRADEVIPVQGASVSAPASASVQVEGEGEEPGAPAEKVLNASEVAVMLADDGDFDDLDPAERAEMIAEVAEEASRNRLEGEPLLPQQAQVEPFTMVMLDGDSSMRQRKNAVDLFKNDPKCRVLLANEKTAGEGLTLIAANHVVQCAPWWTPAVHDQNFSRAYRYPQTKECHQYNLYARGSIETEMVLEICRKKNAIKDRYFGKNAGGAEGMPGNGRAPGLGKAMLGQLLGVY